MSVKKTPSDEQRKIIEAPADANVIVVAGAGSGKTFTMTERVVQLIHEGVPPEHILGLTFTKKAAGELLSRVSQAVIDDARERMRSNPGDAEHMRRVAFMKPDVRTYDAFFQSIVRQYGLLVGFDQQTQPLSEVGARQIITAVVGAHIDDIMRAGFDAGSFNSIVNNVYALSNNIANSMIGDGCTTFEEAIDRVHEWDLAFRKRILELLNVSEEEVLRADPGDPGASTSKAARAVNTKRMRKEKKGETYQETADDAANLEEAMQLDAISCASQLYMVAMKRDLLLSLVRMYAAEKKRRHMAEYSDFVIAAYQLVSRFPSIGARYRRQYTHVLLDEFQDTSTTQSALLSALFYADPTQQGDHATAVSAVGDPYQSIYAWRGASPGAFRMFIDDFHMPKNTEPMSITRTRRNSRIVLQAANNLTKVLRRIEKRSSSANAREVRVEELRNIEGGVDEGTLGVLGFQTRGQEIDAVCRFVKHSVERYGAHDAAGRQDPHVAVLFRGKTAMAAYEDALKQVELADGRHLRVQTVGLSALLDRPEIQDTLSLLRAVSDHRDSESLLRLLATPRYALGAADLKRLSDRANALNAEYRFRALVEAGLADENTPAKERVPLIRKYAQNAPNMVYLIDMLLRDDVEDQLQQAHLSEEGLLGVRQAVTAMHQVQDAMYQPIAQVIRTAVEALNLDVDMLLAGSLADARSVPQDVAHAPIDALLETVNTYVSEIAQQQHPTLRGYLAYISGASSKDMPEVSMDMSDEPADVILMTVHQSKGLEWDAVAVVGVEERDFPSNQGDYLSISTGEAQGSTLDWEPPLYRESAHSWLEQPQAVPVPIRVDANILPKFPNWQPTDNPDSDETSQSSTPIAALQGIDDVLGLEDEAFGQIREELRNFGIESMDPGERKDWALSQREERGRALHADERRLMYVALTRAKHDALVTYSRRPTLSRITPETGWPKNASNFWVELHDALCTLPVKSSDAESENSEEFSQRIILQSFDNQPSQHQENAAVDTDTALSLRARGEKTPEGVIIGEHADEFKANIVDAAWNEPVEEISGTADLPWPGKLSDDVRFALNKGVSNVLKRLTASGDTTEPQHEAPCAAQSSLLQRARLLVAENETLIREDMTPQQIEAAVRKRGQRLLDANARLTTTGLQRNASKGENATEFALEIIRPVPQISSVEAQAGTRFHEWAQRYLQAERDPESTVSRTAMAQRVREQASKETEHDGKPSNLTVWQQRFLESAWPNREPAAVEQAVSTFVTGIGKRVDAKLDAVFYGGIDPADGNIAYTVIDWKTGARPHNAKQRADKLAQLDMYRYFWSKQTGVPMERIDAALFYVSEPEPQQALIVAPRKTEREIIDEMRRGVPESSDND